MAAGLASKVLPPGACVWREQATAGSLKVPIASLSLAHFSSRAQLLWKAARIRSSCGRRRNFQHFVCWTAPNGAYATNADEDKVLQGERPDSCVEGSELALKVPQFKEDSEFGDMEDIEVEEGFKMSSVCDKLIQVFLTERTKPGQWRVLITNPEWNKIRPYFFRRCDRQAKLADDPNRKAALLKLAMEMKSVDEDMQHHNKILAMVEESPQDLDAIVARHREEFTGEFFQHLNILTEANKNEWNRREEIATIASKILISVESHDRAFEDSQSIEEAKRKYYEILSAPSLEEAAERIENLAKNKQLDSTLMALLTKAWASAKVSTLMTDEAKDVMFYLYSVARQNIAKSTPKEIQVIYHLLSIDDPRKRFAEMTTAFSPGDELDVRNEVGRVYTSPDSLLKWMVLHFIKHIQKQS